MAEMGLDQSTLTPIVLCLIGMFAVAGAAACGYLAHIVAKENKDYTGLGFIGCGLTAVAFVCACLIAGSNPGCNGPSGGQRPAPRYRLVEEK